MVQFSLQSVIITVLLKLTLVMRMYCVEQIKPTSTPALEEPPRVGVEVSGVWQSVLAVQVHGAPLPDCLRQVPHECPED